MCLGKNRKCCILCPSTARGRITVNYCHRCHGLICDRHWAWDGEIEQIVCKRCLREAAKPKVAARQ